MRPAAGEVAPTVDTAGAREPGPLPRLSPLERFLRLFTDVRPGEGLTAICMFANVFLILSAYYFVKPLRDGWIAVSDVGGLSSVEVKAYTSFAQSLVLIGGVALYGRLVTRWPRRELITRTTLFCMSNLLIFWALRAAEVAGAGVAFYIWVGIFGLFVVSQFWAFAADLYCDERGRRLLPMIAIGATAGAVTGSFIAATLVNSGVLDASALLLAALLPLTVSIVLSAAADRRGPTGEGSALPRRAAAGANDTGTDYMGALSLVRRHPYLLAVAAVTLLTHWVSTNGDNLLFRTVQEAIRHDLAAQADLSAEAAKTLVRDGTTAFYGSLFFWVNVCALGLQAFGASRLLRYGGFGPLLLLLPVIALAGYTLMAVFPILLVVRVLKTAESSVSYSINNTAQQVLWLPTTAEMKYKAKPAVETLCVRVGDGLAAITVLIGIHFYALPTPSLFLFNVALVCVWLLMAGAVVRGYARMRAAAPAAEAGREIAVPSP